jgi:diketogulonate reductase-like aldo/keto reductase
VQLHWWGNTDAKGDAAASTGIGRCVEVAKYLQTLLVDGEGKGLVKRIGVTNMNATALAALVDAGVPVKSTQVLWSV